jgi:transposase InsO family protein
MNGHRNAKLGLAGRHALVLAIEQGMTLKAAAAAFNVSPATAHRWWHRWLDSGTCERRTLACLSERSSRPLHSPRMLAAKAQERICEVREHTGWGPRLIAGVTGHPHSTVHKILRRHGCSRVPKPPRGEICRYEWDCPGDLLHMDTKRYACFERPGHAVTGVRDKTAAEKRRGVGHEFAHSIVDDHSRLAYSELRPDEQAETVSGFVKRALDFFEGHGITAKRLMTDNAWCYTRSNSLRELLAERQVKHLLIEPHRPQTNGKVERFQQTMAREWAYGLVYRSSEDRRRALPHWIAYYNERRPHSGIGDRPPISRVHNVRG